MPRLVRVFRLLPIVPLLVCTGVAHGLAPVFEPPVPLAGSATTDDPAPADSHPAAATDGAGTWVAAWSSTDSLGGSIGPDADILFARSTDGGLTFTAQAPLNADAAYDTTIDELFIADDQDDSPSLAAHGSRFIAVWHRTKLFAHTIVLARSDDGGEHWTLPTMVYDKGFTPTIRTDGAGTWIVAWSSRANVSADDEIFFVRSVDDGDTWSAPAPLDAGANVETLDDRAPELSWSGGVWVATWSANVRTVTDDREALVARSLDGGATWSPPVALNANAASETALESTAHLASDGAGNWIAVWAWQPSTGDAEILTARSSDGALTWTAATVLNGDAGSDARPDREADVAVGAPGTYVAVWSRAGSQANPNDASHIDVLTATSTDGGVSWSLPLPLNPQAAAAGGAQVTELEPHVAHDPSGYFFAWWLSNDATLASGTKGPDLDVVMALAGHPCGDGVVGPGETCDDGDRGALDCCGRACAYDVAGAVCAADADVCTLERCDGAGTCDHPSAPLGTPCAADTDLCTFDRCDGNAVCEPAHEPRPGCLAVVKPRSSRLLIVDSGTPTRRKLTWDWKHGPATVPSTFATLVTGASYALCVYDATGLVGRVDVPAGGSCGPSAADCWSHTPKGDPKYVDRDGTPAGVTQVRFKSGKSGTTSVKLTGRGDNLPAFGLPIASPPVHAVFVNNEGRCFTATYSSGIRQNASGTFKALGE